MRQVVRSVLALMAVNMFIATPMAMAEKTILVPSAEIPRLPLPSDASLENRLTGEFESAFHQGRASFSGQDSYTALNSLYYYFQLTGQSERIDEILEKQLASPKWACGTTSRRFSEMAFFYCKELRNRGLEDLARRCLRFSTAWLPEKNQIRKRDALAETMQRQYGYFSPGDKMSCASAGSNEAVNTISKYKKDFSFSVSPADRKLDLSPLKGMKNIREFSMREDDRDDLELLPTLLGLRSLSINPKSVLSLDASTLRRLDSISLFCGVDDKDQIVTKEMIDRIARCRNIKGLTLSNCMLGDNALSSVGKLENLKELTLASCKLSANAFSSISTLRNLKELRVERCEFRDTALQVIGDLRGLKTLHLGNNSIQHLPDLSKLRMLESLALDNNPIDDAELASLRNLRELRTLNLMSTHICGTGLRHLCRLSKLDRLFLYDCQDLRSLDGLASLKNIRVLNILGTCIDSSGLAPLAAFRKLSELKFDLPDARKWLPDVCQLQQLKQLNLSNCVVPKELIPDLANLKSLERLELPSRMRIIDPEQDERNKEEYRFADNDIRVLAGLKKLKYLSADHSQVCGTAFQDGFNSLEELDLSACPVSDKSITYISTLRNLKRLSLNSTQITGRSLDSLARCKSLRDLELNGSKIDPEGAEQLAKVRSIRKLGLQRTSLWLDKLHMLKDKLRCSIDPDPDLLEEEFAKKS